MSVTVIVGTQWGDEGKGKVVDVLAAKADIIARYQGGANAGHTVSVDGKQFILHLIPVGIVRPGKVCVIGNGVVVDPEALLNEMDMLRKSGVKLEGRLWVSDRCHLTLPYHKALELAEEDRRGNSKLGTTRKGIGPTYADKTGRIGIRASDLLHLSVFHEKLRAVVEEKNLILKGHYGAEGVSPDRILEEFAAYGETLRPHICDTSKLINEAIDEGKEIIFEGAQGTLLDMDFGTYPFGQACNTLSGACCCGLGVGPNRIDTILGVVKAYTTRVGEGPFPTEFEPDFSERMRERGGEYGATTGRPRRCGWLDGVAVRFAVQINGIQKLALAKVDVLDEFEVLKVGVGYRYEGELLTQFPASTHALWDVQPVYEELIGWQTSTRDLREYDALPPQAKVYINRIEDLACAEISLISVGPGREHTIFR